MLNARKDTSRRHRLGAGYLLTAAVSTFAVCLLADDLARSFLKDGFGFWLVRPVLAIGRTLHSAASSRQVVAWLLVGAVIIASWFWIRLLQRDASAAAATSAVIGGLMAGGSAANNAELAIYGSVCDFIGIRATGIFSLGDVGIVLGIALTPIAAFQLLEGRATVLRLGIGAAVAVCNVMFGLWTAPGGLLLVYLVVLVVVLGGLIWVVREARVSRASLQARTTESIGQRPTVP